MLENIVKGEAEGCMRYVDGDKTRGAKRNNSYGDTYLYVYLFPTLRRVEKGFQDKS
jgi:hypothetical protein